MERLITQQEVDFVAAGERLRGRFVLARQSIPELLILHGAGKATKERAQPLALELAKHHEVSSFAFDFSGHGQSTGTLLGSSLRKRVNEASAAIAFAKTQVPLALCAFSMGGHIALELLERFPVRTLVLFYPAVYSDYAFNLPFGPQFSAAIRQEGSWRGSHLFRTLQSFKGTLLIVIGELDEVIPKDLVHLILDSASRATIKRLIVIPGATHLLLPSLYQSHEGMISICSEIATHLRS